MDESRFLIDDLTDSEFWVSWLDIMSNWLEVELFTAQTLIEFGVIGIAAALAWPLSVRLRKKLQILLQRH